MTKVTVGDVDIVFTPPAATTTAVEEALRQYAEARKAVRLANAARSDAERAAYDARESSESADRALIAAKRALDDALLKCDQ